MREAATIATWISNDAALVRSYAESALERPRSQSGPPRRAEGMNEVLTRKSW